MEAYRQKADEIEADKSRIVKAERAASIAPAWQIFTKLVFAGMFKR